ncbi:MAG: hypothetical protein KJT03_08765 [Verrucomicrobiae bacterium]|nr:hypothetical protein [Verrucomicrobiae bacterium]
MSLAGFQLSAERLGQVELVEGKPLPFDKGVSWEYDGGYMQAFIHDDKFTVVFLDNDRCVRPMDDITLIVLNSRVKGGNGQFYPYHLEPSTGGLYYQNPRYVYRPHDYEIWIALRKEVKRFFAGSRRMEVGYVRPTFEAKRLVQP